MVKRLKSLWMYFKYGMFHTIGYVTGWLFGTFFGIFFGIKYCIPCLRAMWREGEQGIIDCDAIVKMSIKERKCYLEKNSYAYRDYINKVCDSSNKAWKSSKKILF